MAFFLWKPNSSLKKYLPQKKLLSTEFIVPIPFLFLGLSTLKNSKKDLFLTHCLSFLLLETFLYFLIFYSHGLQTPPLPVMAD